MLQTVSVYGQRLYLLCQLKLF